MSTKSKPKTVKCYHCGEKIQNETTDLVLKKIPLHTKKGVRMYTRKFHMRCVQDFVDTLEAEKESQAENKDWEKCYDYFKELLGIPEGKNLDQHATMRILGLRVGKYIPSGNNTRGIKRGYDFESILMTMKYSSQAIKTAFGTMQFKDQKHKIDYAMKIVTNNINFIDNKLSEKRKIENRFNTTETEVFKEQQTAKYDKKGTGNRGKISSMIEGNVSNNELDELEDLFN